LVAGARRAQQCPSHSRHELGTNACECAVHDQRVDEPALDWQTLNDIIRLLMRMDARLEELLRRSAGWEEDDEDDA